MADPGAAGHEDHPDRAQFGHALGVVAGTGRHAHVRVAQRVRRCFHDVAEAGVGGRGEAFVEVIEGDGDAAGLLHRASPPFDLGVEGSDLAHLEVADLERGPHHARHDVRRSRLDRDPADRGDLPPRRGERDLVDGADQVGRGDEGVAALGHGGRPGVVLHARPGDVPATDADDALDDADLDAVGLQERALLNVQLEEARHAARFALDFGDARGVAADAGRALADGEARRGHDVELEGKDPADQRAAPRLAALLVREDDHLEGVPHGDVAVAQGERDFDRGGRSDVAVVAAARRHGVDVRPGDDGERRGVGAGAPADQIAGEVDGDLEAGAFHGCSGVFAAGEVVVAVGEPRGAAVGPAAEPAEVGEHGVEAVAVDGGGLGAGGVRCVRRKGRARTGGGQAGCECRSDDGGGLYESPPRAGPEIPSDPRRSYPASRSIGHLSVIPFNP